MSIINKFKNITRTCAHLLANPREIRRLPRWLRERRASSLQLREPWWPYGIIEFVAAGLPQEPRVFEYGAGGSSLWLVDKGAKLTSVEHHPGWARELRAALPANAELLEFPPSQTGLISSYVEPGYFDEYVQAIDQFPDRSFDLVIVDGRARVDCVLHARPKIKPGGRLLLDDADRKRYVEAVHAMSDWPANTKRGLKAGSPTPSTTTVWTRP